MIKVQKPETTKRTYKMVVEEVYRRKFAVEATSEEDALHIFERTTICDLEEIGEGGGTLMMRYVSRVVPIR